MLECYGTDTAVVEYSNIRIRKQYSNLLALFEYLKLFEYPNSGKFPFIENTHLVQ